MSGTSFVRGENPLRADKLNTAFSERVWRRGDTMQGMLTLWRDPVNPFDAATKQYVDRITVPPQGAMGPPGPQGPMGPPGSITGGTFTGPIYYTATGSTVSRSAQDRAAEVADVLDFGADLTGVADSTAAFMAAAATGKNVYATRGNYLIRDQIPLGGGQELFGDGRGLTTLLIDDTFSSTATGVISLTDREQLSPCVRDMTILFAQPSDQNSRANFKTLAAGGTSGTGGTGVKYPPAIIITTANRFRIYRIRVALAWDGIINTVANTIGGFFIRDIEMSAFNIGQSLDNVFDFGHILGWHAWPFGMSVANLTVYRDGNTFAAKFGVNGTSEGISCVDWTIFQARISIANSDSWLHFANLMMDGNNSTFEVSGCQFIQISNVYFTGAANGANTSAQLQVTGGSVYVSNMWTFGSGTSINISAGSLKVVGGRLGQNRQDTSAVIQTGGTLTLEGLSLSLNRGAGWTVPVVDCLAGTILFLNNRFTDPSLGDVGALVIATDSTQQMVHGNFWNGWGWTIPGSLGQYGFNGTSVHKLVTLGGGATIGSSTATVINLSLQGAAGSARQIPVYSGNLLRWATVVDNSSESGSNAGSNFSISRYNDAGTLIASTFKITRSTGRITLVDLWNSTSYANDAAAAANGVAVAELYRNGSVVQIRIA